jgi:hypothetical protein
MDPFGLADAPPAPAAIESAGTDVDWEDVSEPAGTGLDLSMEDAGPAPAELPPSSATESIELSEDSDDSAPELEPPHAFVPPAGTTGHQAEAEAAGGPGEAALREALSKASREVIERVVWEVVPQLAETIIRENLDKLVKRQKG